MVAREIRKIAEELKPFSITQPLVKSIAREFISKIFDDTLEIPAIKIVKSLPSTMLGATGVYKQDDKIWSIVKVLNSIDDERTLRRVIAHELIHAYEVKVNNGVVDHGTTFQEWAQKFNSVYGHDFVTIHTDKSYANKPKSIIGSSAAILKPIRAYHGSKSPIKKFDSQYSAQGVFWFSDDKDKILRGESGAASTKYLIEVDLKVKNPAGWNEYEKYGLDQIERLGFDSIHLDDDWVVFDSRKIKILKVVIPSTK